MIRPLIVRGLWGDPTTCGRDRFTRRFDDQLTGWIDLRQSVARLVKHKEPCDLFVTFGEDNTRFAKSLGLPVVQSRRAAWAFNPRELPATGHRYGSAVFEGVNGHQHKLIAVLFAMAYARRPILWLDLRVRLMHPLDDGFWSQFTDRDIFRAALIRQFSSAYGAVWRYDHQPVLPGVAQQPFVGATAEMKWLPGGGCMYFADAQLVARATELGELMPWLSDQQLIAGAIDQSHGEWIGVKPWNKLYGLRGYYYGRNRYYFEPADTYFECGQRFEKQKHRWRLWR